ncbi:neuronal acetylcholine receptor subunit alpha-7 isoform X2 [Brachionus plicatilis]|uniref:Neuronal acetylcholine receptor subunit alpha-7 isoform X2 n=1 Tax=Brachionus plicatilis TaxID=10195 RepID=A0A3M7RC27_BRAPC|nr:neuronal acetylcholine receptor subunit alpha-7 isoform X2 [Brachionus plicatilis]
MQNMKKIKFKIGFNAKINRFINCYLFNVDFIASVLVFLLLVNMADAKIGKNSFSKKQSAAFSSMYGPRYQSDQYARSDCNELDYGLLNSDESILRAYLLSNYSPDVRPVINASSVTFVNITLTIIQIMDLDEQNQVMITNAQIALKWFDQHLIWDPEEFSNQTRIVLSSKDIWTPDIVLFNSADVAYSTQRDNYLIDVKSDGSVFWMFPDILRSYCRVNIKYFPFDKQNCTLELQSWSRSKKEVIVYYNNEKPYLNHSFIHTEWKLLNISVLANEQNDFVWLEFTLFLQRNHAFYALFVFWLPPDSGEKITLTITILLALTVFLQLITEYTPKASKSLPIIGLYFNVNLILVLISVILTIIVLNFHFRGPKKQRVPKWMRKYIIGYLGRVFCFCHESNAYFRAQKDHPTDKIQVRKINRDELPMFIKSKENDLLNQEINEFDFTSKSEPAYLKHNRERVTDDNQNSFTKANNLPNQPRNSYEFLNPKTSEVPFSEEISKNLEKMLIKLQKSFDPFKLQDENLKFSILKEILECQRLLLTANLASKKEKAITVNEIYDEWKILAMIVDRICFFVYLSALLMSSVLFLYSEQNGGDEY